MLIILELGLAFRDKQNLALQNTGKFLIPVVLPSLGGKRSYCDSRIPFLIRTLGSRDTCLFCMDWVDPVCLFLFFYIRCVKKQETHN